MLFLHYAHNTVIIVLPKYPGFLSDIKKLTSKGAIVSKTTHKMLVSVIEKEIIICLCLPLYKCISE